VFLQSFKVKKCIIKTIRALLCQELGLREITHILSQYCLSQNYKVVCVYFVAKNLREYWRALLKLWGKNKYGQPFLDHPAVGLVMFVRTWVSAACRPGAAGEVSLVVFIIIIIVFDFLA